MTGLDTRGAFDGFVQGFGMMDGFNHRNEASARADQQMAMQQRGLDMREQEFAAQQGDRQQQQDQQRIAQFYTGWASGIEAPVTPELEEVFKRNQMADPRHLFRPETEAAVQYADKLAKGEGSLFSQQTVDHMNDVYAPRVNRGTGGKKRLAGMYPGQKEGSLVFELEVEDEQGNKSLKPLTVNRSVEGEDDEVAQYGIDQAIAPVMGIKTLYQALGDNREKMMGYLRSSGYLPKEAEKWEQVEGPDGAILQRNTATGEMKSVVGRKSAGANGSYAPSSDVKTLEYLKSQGMSDKEARDELVRLKRGGSEGSISAGDRYRVTFLTNQIEEIDSQLKAYPDESVAEDLEQQRAQLVQARQGLARQLGLVGPDQSQPSQQTQAGAASAEGDDELRSMMYQRASGASRAKGATTEQAGKAAGAGLRAPEPEEAGKRYQLGLADGLLPKAAREAIGSAPGKLATKMNAESLFRKTFNRSPSDDEMAVLLEMGIDQDGRWSAPHWKDLRERFGG